MTAEQLKPVFEREYDRSAWQHILRENFNVSTLLDKPADITSRISSNPYDAKAWELGNFSTTDGHLVGIYEVAVADKVQIHRNRKGLRNLLAQVYNTDVEAALLVFVQGNKWRFSYVSEITVKNKETGKREKKSTDPKRFTYLLGEGERVKTAADRFARIKKSEDLFGKGVTLTALEEAFNVEKMSKAFFNEYRKQYGQFTAHLTGEDENGKKVKNASPFLKTTFNGDHKAARDFVKKMLGRIVFLYFLEKKGWLGVPEKGAWGDGDENFLSNLFYHSKDKKAFYSNVLVPLFFATLNTERKNDRFKIDDSLFTKPGYSQLKIPYLNGGLFEEDETMTQFLVFPEELFRNLFTFFDQYNFTVYEDSPDEHTVAVDPEMLGHIFENLLEDNKDKGAFYTPKEIVHYMCRESLIEYLYTKLNPQLSETGGSLSPGEGRGEVARTAIEKLVQQHEAADIIEYDEAILKALKDVKICDPAIGSGAFPMSLLMEIFHLVETLYDASPDVTEKIWELKKGWNPAQVKESIIQNSIYGVDIEKGAVDIARLRFWLSLVVEEDTPKPLPNLDYKIVVGNSLLSKFEDEVIDIDWSLNSAKATEATRIIITQQAGNLNTLQSWQTAYFYQKGDKQKQQKEIRDKKIDIICNQLTLSKISFQQNNPKLGGFAPTAKEIQRNLENEIKLATFDKIVQKLQGIKKNKTSVLNFFDWKLDFPEVMNEKVAKCESGFDIVIGNPPYMRVQEIERTQKDDKIYLERKYKVAKGSYELANMFFELAVGISNSTNSSCFIFPHKFLNATNSITFREYLLETKCVSKLLHFGANMVFNEADTYTCICFFNKRKKSGFLVQKFGFGEPFLELLYESKSFTHITYNQIQESSKFYGSNQWIILKSEKEYLLFNKIYRKSKTCKDVFEDIFQGIATSNDKLYILSNVVVKGNYIEADSQISGVRYKLEKEFFKPILKGKDVKRYDQLYTDNYVFFPYKIKENGEPVTIAELQIKYPLTFKYIKDFEKEFKERERGKAALLKNWFAYIYPKNINKFERTKLSSMEICSLHPNVTINKTNLYHNTKVYSWIKKENVKESYEYLLSIVNSKLFWWFLQNTGDTLQGDARTFKTNYINPFPIPEQFSVKIDKELRSIVDNIMNEKSRGNLTDILEKEIDLRIYKLYSLTYEEACIVEGNTDWISKEEYEQFKME